MGFHLKSQLRKSSNNLLVSVLTKFVLIAISAGLVSCLVKKPDLSNNDGEQASLADIDQQLVQAWGSEDFDSILAKGEFATYMKTVKISSLSSRITSEHAMTVLERDAKKAILAHLRREYDENGQAKDYPPVQSEISFGSDESSQGASAMALEAFVIQPLGKDYHPLEEDSPNWKMGYFSWLSLRMACDQKYYKFSVKCFNLKAEAVMEPLPIEMQKTTKCEGFPDCLWQVHRVSFDFLAEVPDESGQVERIKYKYNISLAQAAPFLGRLTSFCVSGLTEINKQKYPFESCEKLRDTRWGAPPTEER